MSPLTVNRNDTSAIELQNIKPDEYKPNRSLGVDRIARQIDNICLAFGPEGSVDESILLNKGICFWGVFENEQVGDILVLGNRFPYSREMPNTPPLYPAQVDALMANNLKLSETFTYGTLKIPVIQPNQETVFIELGIITANQLKKIGSKKWRELIEETLEYMKESTIRAMSQPA